MVEDVFELVGETISKYRVDEVVADGFFAVVYRGWHVDFDQPIAIKCLKVPFEARKQFLENFRNEGKFLSSLSRRHQSIVHVYDCGEFEVRGGYSVPYLVLEWLPGRDLRAVLNERLASGRGPYDQREAVALLKPVLEAIAAAHSGDPSIAHRDLKPENIFVMENASTVTIKVLDFGIAKAMPERKLSTRAATGLPGSLPFFSEKYGAPEQFRRGNSGYGASGPWTDVHALGLILVELVTGRPALDGEDIFGLMASATATKRPTPRARGAGSRVSDQFEAVCAKALALNPSDRFRDARALLNALQVSEQRPSPAASAPKHVAPTNHPNWNAAPATPTVSDVEVWVKGVGGFIMLIVGLIWMWKSIVALGWVH